MTEKRFTLKYIEEQHLSANLYDDKTFIGSIGIGEELIVELLNDLSDENEQLKQTIDKLTLDNTKQKKVLNGTKKENKELKQELQSIEDNFKFCCSENRIEFDKDEIEVKDTHTELILKDGKLCISVFIPQINEYFKFFYLVTGRRLERELINYDGDVK